MSVAQKITDLAFRKQGDSASGSSSSPSESSSSGPLLPKPASLIDGQMIEDAALSTLRGTLKFEEARDHVKSFHRETANAEFSQSLAHKREAHTRAKEEFDALAIRVAEVEGYRNSLEQYSAAEPATNKSQKPWSRFTGFEFGFLFAAVLVALGNGSLAIANYLLARPEYADGMFKALGIGLSILLLPSLTLTLIYHFLRKLRPKAATIYALTLFALVGVCVVVFIVAFGLSNAQSGQEGDLSLADLGVSDLGTSPEPPGLEYLPAIALIFQILTDLLAAAAAKIGLVFLWENHGWVFTPKNPKWNAQSKELVDLKTRKGVTKALCDRLEVELGHLDQERENFGLRVSKLADTIFCRKYQTLAAFQRDFRSL